MMYTQLYKIDNPKPTGYLKGVKTYNYIFIRLNREYYFTIWDYFKRIVSDRNIGGLQETIVNRVVKYFENYGNGIIGEVNVMYKPGNVVDALLNVYPTLILDSPDELYNIIKKDGVFSQFFNTNIKYDEQVLSHIFNSLKGRFELYKKQGNGKFKKFLLEVFDDYFKYHTGLRNGEYTYFEVPIFMKDKFYGVYIVRSSEGQYVPSERLFKPFKFTPYYWVFHKIIERNEFVMSSPYYDIDWKNVKIVMGEYSSMKKLLFKYLFPRGLQTEINFDILTV